MIGGCHYWELRLVADWKSFSVGVAYRSSLGRFDQLGKSTGSWCLHASQWLQNALAAKHNNRVKTLEWLPLQQVGIYCDYDNGTRGTTTITFKSQIFDLFLFLSADFTTPVISLSVRRFSFHWRRATSSPSLLQNKVCSGAGSCLHCE